MSILEIFWAAGAGHLPGRRGRRAATHVPDDQRSAAWNQWRTNQALHPTGRRARVEPAPRTAAMSEHERRSRRSSTRASRSRTARKAASR